MLTDAELTAIAEREGARIDVVTGRPLAAAMTDTAAVPDAVTVTVNNRLRNAIDAGAAGVQLRTRVEHGARIGEDLVPLALRLEVGDDGRGVPPELAEQIFLPLVSGRADGTGLGLALAQQVAREHRGSLTYRSRPGHTVFTLLLPLAADEEAEP